VRVTEATGIKIPAINPEQATTDLAVALEQLAGDPLRLAQLAGGGRRRVDQEFNWDRRGEHLARLYVRLLNSTAGTSAVDRSEAVAAARQEP